jgi:murein DD-endopeptidase MepM/ murein hydrolase activator NlpD
MPLTMPTGFRRAALLGVSLAALAACEPDGSFDGDFRHFGTGGFDTSDAARAATGQRPTPDARGVISYPTYQVAVARTGDTIEAVAARVGVSPGELANYNAIQPGTTFNGGEVLALPRGAGAGSPALGTLPQGGATGGGIDVTTIASGAIAKAEAGGAGSLPQSAPVAAPAGAEPVRHQVVRGETAYTIARLYNVNVRSLAEWNGLGADLAVREGQYLLIPVAAAAPAPAVPAPQPPATTAPGQGSQTPVPPSASKPLPAEKTVPAAKAPAPPAPDMGAQKSAASATRLSMPASGKIIRGYQKGKNAGIDISAPAGSPVTAAADGTVRIITKTAQGVPIIVLRHDGDLLTVYASVDNITVAKGDTVKRGQKIAAVRAGDAPYVHFEVRRGTDSVDPMPYLQ